MHIALFDVKKEEKEFFKKSLKKHKLLFFDKPVQDVPVAQFAHVDMCSVFIYSKLSKAILLRCKKLKCVVTRSTGFDHVDTKYCASKKILVAHVPHYGENTVAEHTFALLMSLSRKVHKSFIRTMQGDYSIDGLQGFDLKGKTLGVVGVGRIGMHVIRIAKGFGMHVKAYDVHHDTFLSELLHFTYSDIDDLIKQSDIVTLHMPYLPSTHHFMNKKRLQSMKKGAILINTARGGLVDTDALYHLLKKGHLGGVGLDVIEGEELVSDADDVQSDAKQLWQVFRDKEIFSMDNVIFTPHNAFNSSEAVHRIMQTSVDNMLSFAQEGAVLHAVPSVR